MPLHLKIQPLIKAIVLVSIALNGLIITEDILLRQRLTALPGGAATALALTAFAVSGAIWSIVGPPSSLTQRIIALIPLLIITARFHLPALKEPKPILSKDSEKAQALLRFMVSAQEEYRREFGQYASDLVKLKNIPEVDTDKLAVEITSKDDRWWHGVAKHASGRCEVHVGYFEHGPVDQGKSEGVPDCGKSVERLPHQRILGTNFTGQPVKGLLSSDTTENWPQHRSNSERTGITGSMTDPGYRWDAQISGELRASASIAGNAVYVGAHGNGEIAALELRTGRLLWRARAPNWIHHEPIVAGQFVAYGFGNNEGTSPSGFDLRDRRTGALVWRRLTKSAAMGAPIIAKGNLFGVEAEGRIHSWEIKTGNPNWERKTSKVGLSPMANPLYTEAAIYQTYEPTGWCIFRPFEQSGPKCAVFSFSGHGAGHSSAAIGDSLLLFTGASREWLGWKNHVFGHGREKKLSDAPTGSISIFAVSTNTGNVRWRNVIHGTSRPVAGHIAGTPVVKDGIAYIPLPTIGKLVAIRITNGEVLWHANVDIARGSVTAIANRIFAATSTNKWVILDPKSGNKICLGILPGPVDRAPLSVSGNTGILTFLNGRVSAAPIDEWLECKTTWKVQQLSSSKVNRIL